MPTESKTLENLLALIDSGKEENLEMALQLSANLADEWKWINVMIQSRKRLPTGYRSWYEAYAKAVEFDHERILFPVMADGKVDYQTYTMTEIHQGVALDLHYQLFRIDRAKLISGIVNTEQAVRQMVGPNVTKSTVLKLAEWVSTILPTR